MNYIEQTREQIAQKELELIQLEERLLEQQRRMDEIVELQLRINELAQDAVNENLLSSEEIEAELDNIKELEPPAIDPADAVDLEPMDDITIENINRNVAQALKGLDEGLLTKEEARKAQTNAIKSIISYLETKQNEHKTSEHIGKKDQFEGHKKAIENSPSDGSTLSRNQRNLLPTGKG